MTEAEFIAALRAIATDPAARGLADDAAVLETQAGTLVISCDMIAEGVHFLPDDPPEDVAWKLVAVNLSDLAAKGARPAGALLGYSLGGEAWDRAFLAGLRQALDVFSMPLLGGDTIAAPAGARTLSLTAIGRASGPVPSRAGARPGDWLWTSGAIGDSGAGLALLRAGMDEPAALIARYRSPRPRLEAGERLASMVTAMMDVSDGLLLDAERMAAASGCRLAIEIGTLPLSEALIATRGEGLATRMAAASAGDDYELLFAAGASESVRILALGEEIGLSLTPIGRFEAGAGIVLSWQGEEIALPDRLGFEHGNS